MKDTKHYLKAVLRVLEMGADGRCTKQELESKMKETRILGTGIHLIGSRGLFEESKDGTLRLNREALGLYLNHLSIEQAKSLATRAMRFAGASLLIAAVSCVITLLASLCST